MERVNYLALRDNKNLYGKKKKISMADYLIGAGQQIKSKNKLRLV